LKTDGPRAKLPKLAKSDSLTAQLPAEKWRPTLFSTIAHKKALP
jgi:hypothetical protein